MLRIVSMLLWLVFLHTPAFALDIWCSTLTGAVASVPPYSDDKLQARAAELKDNPAFRRPLDVEVYLKDINILATKPVPECATAVFTGKIEADDVGKVEAFLHRNPRLSTVYLASLGGDLAAAMKIGRQFHNRSVETVAPSIGTPGSERELWLLSNAAKNGSWKYLNSANAADTWGAEVCRGPDCLCASACFVAWAGGIKREGEALGLHRPTLDEQYLTSASPQQAQIQFQEAVRQTRLFLAEMEVPQFFIEKMFDTDRENVYIVGDDLSEYKNDPLKTVYRGLLGYPPSIRDWVEASCRVASSTAVSAYHAIMLNNLPSNPRIMALGKTISDGQGCENLLWSIARAKNTGLVQ